MRTKHWPSRQSESRQWVKTVTPQTSRLKSEERKKEKHQLKIKWDEEENTTWKQHNATQSERLFNFNPTLSFRTNIPQLPRQWWCLDMLGCCGNHQRIQLRWQHARNKFELSPIWSKALLSGRRKSTKVSVWWSNAWGSGSCSPVWNWIRCGQMQILTRKWSYRSSSSKCVRVSVQNQK